MAEKLKYYSVGDLRAAIKDMADDVPVVSAPLNDKIRVALDLNIYPDAKKKDIEQFKIDFKDMLEEENVDLNEVE